MNKTNFPSIQPDLDPEDLHFSKQEINILKQALGTYTTYVKESTDGPIKKRLRFRPQTIESFLSISQGVANQLVGLGKLEAASGQHYYPFLKAALILYRREKADSVEERIKITMDSSSLDILDEELAEIDRLVNSYCLKDVTPYPTPTLSDFLTVQAVEEILKESSRTNQLEKRIYDEKFGILMAPSLFLSDLNYYRYQCEIRKINLMVAYIDIDHFKKFNDDHGESTVDRLLLPQFMSKLEAYVFNRGYVYRYGGDEYMMLIPNMNIDEGTPFLHGLHENLKTLILRTIKSPLTISIGAYFVAPKCIHTNSEIEKKAEEAKQFAKETRNCSAVYIDNDNCKLL